MIIRLFGQLRTTVGSGSLTAPETLSTVGEVEDWLIAAHPDLAGHRRSWRLAVDQEYAQADTPVSPSSEVAVIPPVSGGGPVLVELVEESIDPDRWRLREVPPTCGAVAEFSGTVRDSENGDAIRALHYEIYPGMTQKELRRVAEETLEAHPIREIRVVHRHGRIDVGEIALWVQVMAPHRAEAFAAVEHCIRRIKEIVPIWKVDPVS